MSTISGIRIRHHLKKKIIIRNDVVLPSREVFDEDLTPPSKRRWHEVDPVATRTRAKKVTPAYFTVYGLLFFYLGCIFVFEGSLCHWRVALHLKGRSAIEGSLCYWRCRSAIEGSLSKWRVALLLKGRSAIEGSLCIWMKNVIKIPTTQSVVYKCYTCDSVLLKEICQVIK